MNRIDSLIAKYCPNGGAEFFSIEEIFIIRNGYTPSKMNKAFWINGTIPWFRMEDIREKGRILSKSIQLISEEAARGGKLFPANSILIATSATIGEHALITVPHLSNQTFTSLSLQPAFASMLDMRFVFYYCFILGKWCLNNQNKSIFSSINRANFRKFKFPIPPLEVQEEIVRILDIFTDLQAELELLLEAELAARRKQYHYYRDKLLQFEGSDVKWVEMKEICVYSKTRIAAANLNQDNYVGVDNLLQHCTGKTTSSYVPENGNFTFYKNNDILIGNIRPYLKKIWHADRTGGASGDVLVVQIKNEQQGYINPRYLYQVLADNKFFKYNMRSAKGAKMPRGDKAAIMDYKIPVPSIEEQNRIISTLDKFDALVNDLLMGLPAEIAARRKQYEYYCNKLLTFEEA